MIEHEQQRLQNWRLKILQEAQGKRLVASTCRRYGISRKTFYKWRNRYQQQGLTSLRDRPLGPHHCPSATPLEIVEKILYLRQHYHMGPWRIGMYLKRYHPPRGHPRGERFDGLSHPQTSRPQSFTTEPGA